MTLVRPVTPPLSTNDLDEAFKCLNLPFVSVDLNYLTPLDIYHLERPYLSRLPFIDELKRSNVVIQNHSVKMFDVSGHEDLFNLEDSGFEFTKAPVAMDSWTDSTVCSDYLPKLAEWLQEHLNCLRVFIYAYNVSLMWIIIIRQARVADILKFRGQNPDNNEKKSSKSPFLRVHCGNKSNFLME